MYNHHIPVLNMTFKDKTLKLEILQPSRKNEAIEQNLEMSKIIAMVYNPQLYSPCVYL